MDVRNYCLEGRNYCFGGRSKINCENQAYEIYVLLVFHQTLKPYIYNSPLNFAEIEISLSSTDS